MTKTKERLIHKVKGMYRSGVARALCVEKSCPIDPEIAGWSRADSEVTCSQCLKMIAATDKERQKGRQYSPRCFGGTQSELRLLRHHRDFLEWRRDGNADRNMEHAPFYPCFAFTYMCRDENDDDVYLSVEDVEKDIELLRAAVAAAKQVGPQIEGHDHNRRNSNSCESN
jgi:hypothetical protein